MRIKLIRKIGLGHLYKTKKSFIKNIFPETKSLNDIIDLKFKRKKNIIKNRYFKEFATIKLLKRKMADISDAEKIGLGWLCLLKRIQGFY